LFAFFLLTEEMDIQGGRIWGLCHQRFHQMGIHYRIQGGAHITRRRPTTPW